MVVWIEIDELEIARIPSPVTTCVVVWIEIAYSMISSSAVLSPPAWWCGLKLKNLYPYIPPKMVTTCVVVWIEILHGPTQVHVYAVTTCVVVWIEIVDLYAR